MNVRLYDAFPSSTVGYSTDCLNVSPYAISRPLGFSIYHFNTREFAWSSAMRIFLPAGYGLQHLTNDQPIMQHHRKAMLVSHNHVCSLCYGL